MREGSTMKAWRVVLTLAISTSASCMSPQVKAPSDFVAQIKGAGEVNLTGWLRLRGEVMLFVNQEAMHSNLRYPYCISGVFPDQAERNISYFDGKKVIIYGELFKYESLDSEDASILQRKLLAGSVVPNFCFGERVILIHKIGIASR